MKYIWTEDTRAGFHFWKLVNEHLFHGDFVVESKGSNQGVLDAVRQLVPNDRDKKTQEYLMGVKKIFNRKGN